jgi:phosphoesterase RecJ-like protein
MLNKILTGADMIAISGHIRPDGDCVGSCMGLAGYIRENYEDKQVDVYLEEIPDAYYCIQGTDQILHKMDPEKKVYDLFICLDCGDEGRLGDFAELFRQAKRTYCIDHHLSNTDFAMDSYVVPDASSTSELVYDLLEKDRISLPVAEALYLGIVHDTGVFQYSCASPSTFRAAAKLLEIGVDAPTLITDTYYEKTYAQNKILGRALDSSKLLDDGRYIVSVISQEEMKAYGASAKDLDGIVSQLRVTKGVEVAIFLYQLNDEEYKVSLRSKDRFDVSSVAVSFGGGGHMKAAGVTMKGSPEDIVEKLTAQLNLQA